jgi:hypothetical protein
MYRKMSVQGNFKGSLDLKTISGLFKEQPVFYFIQQVKIRAYGESFLYNVGSVVCTEKI